MKTWTVYFKKTEYYLGKVRVRAEGPEGAAEIAKRFADVVGDWNLVSAQIEFDSVKGTPEEEEE